ncbi:hypothetical protein HX882_07700 [Pseudomonas gingeri]|uniref:Tetratricopeptide repeat protein n=1 Tax=Pseudomonas gingeri TaxID=117681 RepID=A0A7Y7X9N6_9PSED|nr:hypothetical protein [Pseudomonas gingeri]NWB95767.1 hypothetical protein [Pseudomonas gingeri]
MLDASEYLHLAIHASQEGNHHAALNYLNTALEHEPNHAGARYFLAAEHAELGLLERAHTGMKAALELDSGMDIARFQLGLLSLQLQRTAEAQEAFESLQRVTLDTSLQTFAGAYLDLLSENAQEAIAKLSLGLNTCVNQALHADMSRVLASLTELVPETESSSPTERPVFLGAYRNTFETP